MKSTKILMLAAFAMAFAACSNDSTDDVKPNGTKTVTLSVDTELTRTELSADRTQLQWTEGDKFGVFTDGADANTAVEYAGSKTFELTVDAKATKIQAYYPWSEAATAGDHVEIAAEQTQSEGGKLNGANYPLVGEATIAGNAAQLLLKPAATALALNVYGATTSGEKVKSITFTTSSMNVSSSAKSAKVTVAGDVTAEGVKPADAQTYADQIYLVVKKNNYPDGTIAVQTTEKLYTFTLTEAIDCRTKDFVALNLNLANAESPKYSYNDLLGYYAFIHKNGATDYVFGMTLKANVVGESYSVDMWDQDGGAWYQDPDIEGRLQFDYVIDENAPLKVLLPQVIRARDQFEIVALKGTDKGAFRVYDEGVGYDLTLVDSGDDVVFDFIPNAASTGLELNGLWMSPKGASSYWNCLTPATGYQYLRLVKVDGKLVTKSLEFDNCVMESATPKKVSAIPGAKIENPRTPDAWIKIDEITETSFNISVDANTTSGDRTGSVMVDVDGVTEVVTVKQTSNFVPESLVGTYTISFKNKTDGTATKTMTLEQHPDKSGYLLMKYTDGSITYTAEFGYEGTMPVAMTFACPQMVHNDYTYNPGWGGPHAGNTYKFYARACLAGGEDTTKITADGAGFNLTYDGNRGFNFVPNDVLSAANPDAKSLGFFAEQVDGTLSFSWLVHNPLDGQTYLNITKQ